MGRLMSACQLSKHDDIQETMSLGKSITIAVLSGGSLTSDEIPAVTSAAFSRGFQESVACVPAFGG